MRSYPGWGGSRGGYGARLVLSPDPEPPGAPIRGVAVSGGGRPEVRLRAGSRGAAGAAGGGGAPFRLLPPHLTVGAVYAVVPAVVVFVVCLFVVVVFAAAA